MYIYVYVFCLLFIESLLILLNSINNAVKVDIL